MLLPWLPTGLWTVWAGLALELAERKVGGAAVEVGWLLSAEAEDVVEILNPLLTPKKRKKTPMKSMITC